MEELNCPICNTKSSGIFKKSGISYDICPKCNCCYTLDYIDPETDNEGDKARNLDNINKLRMERIIFYGPDNNSLVDFGCGNGQFVDFAGIFFNEVYGIDKNTDMQLLKLTSNSIDVINCVEVIEHLIKPREIVEEFYRILRPDGIVYLESSFTDNLVDLSKSSYVDPNIGHVLIHSKKSIEILFDKFEVRWLNNNVVIFKKV
ncbi:MAG: class I SAM-dependent methyltransferase [Sphingobacteriaceae bacterium]